MCTFFLFQFANEWSCRQEPGVCSLFRFAPEKAGGSVRGYRSVCTVLFLSVLSLSVRVVGCFSPLPFSFS